MLQICRQYEKPLVLQLCRLVRGFTHPASYFAGHGDPASVKKDRSSRGGGARENEEDLALFSVDEFSAEMASVPHFRCPAALKCTIPFCSSSRGSSGSTQNERDYVNMEVGLCLILFQRDNDLPGLVHNLCCATCRIACWKYPFGRG